MPSWYFADCKRNASSTLDRFWPCYTMQAWQWSCWDAHSLQLHGLPGLCHLHWMLLIIDPNDKRYIWTWTDNKSDGNAVRFEIVQFFRRFVPLFPLIADTFTKKLYKNQLQTFNRVTDAEITVLDTPKARILEVPVSIIARCKVCTLWTPASDLSFCRNQRKVSLNGQNIGPVQLIKSSQSIKSAIKNVFLSWW